MYRTRQIIIRKGHRFFQYCKEICQSSASLYNRANYLIRQYATALTRNEQGEELTQNQKDAVELIRCATEETRYAPKGKWLTYGQLDYVLKATRDAAYFHLPAQANQQILKRILRDYKSFFEAVKVYTDTKEIFTGRPGMPGYRKKGSMITAVLTNQICRIKEEKYLRFPGTGEKINIGKLAGDVRLKEVRIKPHADCFVLDIVLEITEDEAIENAGNNKLCLMEQEELKKHLAVQNECHYRVAAIDPGTNNFCAVTNNFGKQPFLIRGGIIKSENRYYNKTLARLKSEAKRCNGVFSTKRISRLHDKRNRRIRDWMHKISRMIVRWAQENQVEVIVMGHNAFQKQKIDIGHTNNQNFVQIPFAVFAGMLRYKLNEKGIAFLETEESYTSKADFLAKDPIPEYKKDRKAITMSGTRIHRGLYEHGNGRISNADINGAANILRKVFPNVTEWDSGVVDTPYAVRIA